jgi:hypothetical protein
MEHRQFTGMSAVTMSVTALLATVLHALEAGGLGCRLSIPRCPAQQEIPQCSIRLAPSQATATRLCT